jgi:hypothetical protein
LRQLAGRGGHPLAQGDRVMMYVYLFLVVPLGIVAAIVITRHQRRQMLARVKEVGVGRVMTEHFGHFFKLQPGEELVRFWGGLIYTGDLVPEYKDTVGDKVGRALGNAALRMINTRRVFYTARVLVGLTNQARVVVARDNEHFCPTPYAAFGPGEPIYVAADFPGQNAGTPTAEVRRFAANNKKKGSTAGKIFAFVVKQMRSEKIAAPGMPRMAGGLTVPGISDDVAFVLFGRDEGARMPAWMTGDIANILMRWRNDPIGTTAELTADAGPTAATLPDPAQTISPA